MDYYLAERIADWEPEWQLIEAFLSPERGAALGTVCALRAEWWDLLLIRDEQVLMARLQWWLEEWQRLGEGAPRHPVTRALETVRPESLPGLQRLLAVAQGWRAEVSELRSEADLMDRLGAAAAVLGAFDPQPDGEQAWRQILLLDFVTCAPALARSGLTVIPVKAAARQQLTSRELAADPASARAFSRHMLADSLPAVPGDISSDAWLLRVSAVQRHRGRSRLRKALALWATRRRIGKSG